MFKKFAGLLALLVSTTAVQAMPVTITQVFSDVTLDADGFPGGPIPDRRFSGDWIFKGTVDSDAPILLNHDWEIAYAATVRLTQLELGLVDVTVTNLNYLYFSNQQIGFDVTAEGGTDAFTSTRWDAPVFDSISHFPSEATFAALPVATGGWNVFGPVQTGFVLGNGTTIYGFGTAVSSQVSAQFVKTVPEPETWAMLLVGLVPLTATLSARRRRRA
jgi:hypothetical protein